MAAPIPPSFPCAQEDPPCIAPGSAKELMCAVEEIDAAQEYCVRRPADTVQPLSNHADIHPELQGQLMLPARRPAGIMESPYIDVAVLGRRGAYVLHKARSCLRPRDSGCRSILLFFIARSTT